MRDPVLSIVALALIGAAVLVADRPAHAQASATVGCKDGTSYTVSVPGGSCKAEPGQYATCVGATEGTESKAVCGGGCTSGGDGKCEAKTASTPPPGPKIRPGAAPKPAGVKTTVGTSDQQKSKIGAVAAPPAGVKSTGADDSGKSASKTNLKDLTITKPVDKSSPRLMQGGGAASSVDDARNLCSKNPACRVVRDDADLTAFCVGDNCVAARKAGKGQQEYIKATMSDVLIGRISGTPIKTSQGIIAILIGNVAPPAARPADNQKGAPPPSILEGGSGTASPTSAPSGARIKSIREGTTVPTGPGGPMMK